MAATEPDTWWDTLQLSATPLRARSDILVVSRVTAKQGHGQGYVPYRMNFEINRYHGLVSHDIEVMVAEGDQDEPAWRHSIRRDLVLAIRDRFLTTQLYAHAAHQLGWTS